jgi:protein SCO1/2
MTVLTTPDTDDQPEQPPPISARSRRWITAGALLVVVAALGFLVAKVAVSALSPHLYAGTVLQGDDPAPSMEGLVFTDGAPVDLGAFGGEVLLVYFGYTNCPDVCPTTLATAARAVAGLDPEDRERTRLLMVSVDPARDGPDYLQTYMEFFDPSFLGATGDVDALDVVTSQYGVYYQLGKGEDYTVDHTASIMGIGTDGALRIIWPPDVTAEALTGDIAELLS